MLDDICRVLIGVELQGHMLIIYVLCAYIKRCLRGCVGNSSVMRTRARGSIRDARRLGPDPKYVLPCGTWRSDRIARQVFIRKESHRQTIAAG